MKISGIALLGLGLMLTACTGTGAPPDARVKAPSASPGSADAGNDLGLWARVGGLPAQTIRPDSCGLFLWADLPKRTLVFFTDSLGTNGAIMYDGEVTNLPLQMARGDKMLGLFSNLAYENDRVGLTVSYTAEAKEGLRGGAVIREGTWRLKEKGGWELVLPVAGLIGCR